jgi:hypothetical protein
MIDTDSPAVNKMHSAASPHGLVPSALAGARRRAHSRGVRRDHREECRVMRGAPPHSLQFVGLHLPDLSSSLRAVSDLGADWWDDPMQA